jgi:hypothetical protein
MVWLKRLKLCKLHLNLPAHMMNWKITTGMLLLLGLAIGRAGAQGEFNGPFPSWLNVRTVCGAKGDGVTDDTRALQTALLEASSGVKYNTLYLPAGIYVVTKTLELTGRVNVAMIGADPLTTVIKWAGPAGGTILRLNGVAYSRFDRLDFDGKGMAEVAVEQSWDGSHPQFDTANEYADDIFTDVGFGLHGGHLGHGFAETTVLRDRFVRNSKAGVSLGNFNALDIWVRDCLFDHCAIGVTNRFGAGNYKIYGCLFRCSADADLSMGNTGEFSVRGNTSVGSGQFFNAGYSRNPACIVISGNTVLDPVKAPAVFVGNQGPVIFMHNVIRSVPGTGGYAVVFSSDGIAADNAFTLADAVVPGKRGIAEDNRRLTPGQAARLAAALPCPFQPAVKRKVFEVPFAADAGVIQNLISEAAKLSGTRPVIHFPLGSYNISHTLLVPAGSDMQFTGDGFGDRYASLLRWTGGRIGTMLQIAGEGKVVLKDLSLRGDTGIINIETGAQVVFLRRFHQENGQTGILAQQGLVLGQDIALSGLKTAVMVMGKSCMFIEDGAESNNILSHEISGNASLSVQDCWYEGGVKSIWASLSGSGAFMAFGDHIAVLSKSAAIVQHDFSGKAVLAASDLSGLLDPVSGIITAGNLAEDESFSAGTTLLNRARNHGSTALYGGSFAINDIRPDTLRVIRGISAGLPENSNSSGHGAGLTLDGVLSIGGKIGLCIKDMK